MGFWKQLFGTDKIPYHLKPPMPKPTPPERPKANISEPVISLLETIKNQEWEYLAYRGSYSTSYFVHVWNRKELFVSQREGSYCTAGWMNDEERKVVGVALVEARGVYNNYWTNKIHKQDRDSFMIFVKEPNETN